MGPCAAQLTYLLQVEVCAKRAPSCILKTVRASSLAQWSHFMYEMGTGWLPSPEDHHEMIIGVPRRRSRACWGVCWLEASESRAGPAPMAGTADRFVYP